MIKKTIRIVMKINLKRKINHNQKTIQKVKMKVKIVKVVRKKENKKKVKVNQKMTLINKFEKTLYF